MQAEHLQLQASYKVMEEKLREAQQATCLKTNDNIESLHKHYAAKLDKLKIQMVSRLCNPCLLCVHVQYAF